MYKTSVITLFFFLLIGMYGCGSTTPTTAQDFNTVLTGNTANTTAPVLMGTLTIGGTGSAITGTSFSALYITNTAGTISLSHIWSNVPNAIYPMTGVMVMQNASGSIVSITVVRYTSATSLTGYWSAAAPVSASSSATAISFNNAIIPGAMGTITSLTLNGTLKF